MQGVDSATCRSNDRYSDICFLFQKSGLWRHSQKIWFRSSWPFIFKFVDNHGKSTLLMLLVVFNSTIHSLPKRKVFTADCKRKPSFCSPLNNQRPKFLVLAHVATSHLSAVGVFKFRNRLSKIINTLL